MRGERSGVRKGFSVRGMCEGGRDGGRVREFI